MMKRSDTCDFLENTLTLSDLNITLPIKRTRLEIDSITLLKSRITSNATLMVQEEQCAHNPLAVMPQMKVVAIKKINSDLELEMKFDNVRIEYPDFHFEYKCTKFLFWKTCYPDKLKFTREDRFSHTAKLTINNFKQSIIRDSTFTNRWKLGPTFSKGSRSVQIEPSHLFNTNHRLRYRNALLTILNEKVIESRSAMKDKIDKALNDLSIVETNFDQNNCLAPTNAFYLGGNVSGYSTGNLVLQNNYSDNLLVKSSGSFTFPDKFASRSNFKITVKEHPANFICTVSNGAGFISNADSTSTTIDCQPDSPDGTVIDLATNLMWAQCSLVKIFYLQPAMVCQLVCQDMKQE